MQIKNEIQQWMGGKSEAPAEMVFTFVFRELDVNSGESGYVAECLEIPGCISEGETKEEAEANIKDAVRGCLSVIFEDCIREISLRRSKSISYVGISSQETVRVTVPELQFA
jgi:predicted RNase H-like HicB family nuclease